MGLSYTPIEMEWFYYVEGDKTKLNWFLLEVALEYYGRIQDSKELAPYREQYNSQQIAQFCGYFARRLKKSMLDCLLGRSKAVVIDQEQINDFYPNMGDDVSNPLAAVASDAISHMLEACERCPHQCLRDYAARCPFFDQYKD